VTNLKSGKFYPRRMNVSSRQCAMHFPHDIYSGTGGVGGYPLISKAYIVKHYFALMPSLTQYANTVKRHLSYGGM